MKKILIATRNKDKYRIISKLLGTKNFEDYEFISLNDIEDIIEDKKEDGDVINRSYEKALNVYNNLKNNIYDYIVGIDDGIKMKGQMIENLKEYIKPIMDNEYLKENEEILIVRAYTFINKKGEHKSIITEIPFKYIPLKENYEIKENSYPFSHVMAPLNSSKTVSEMNEDETNLYYLDFSKNAYNEVESYFHD